MVKHRGRSPAANACAIAALAAIAVACAPPLERAADRSFAWHMAQHMLFVYAAPPLLLLARPLHGIWSRLSASSARRLAAALRSWPVRAAGHPVVAWLLFAAVLWGSHFSGIYETALERPAVHAAEHAAFVGAGLLFWYPIVAPPSAPAALSYPFRMAYVFSAIPQGAFLGLALDQTRFVLYPHYIHSLGSAAVALADQQAGGALMWLAGGCVFFIAFMALGVAWWNDDRRRARREAGMDVIRTPAGIASLALLGAVALAATRASAAENDGRTLYAEHCASCHGAYLQGSSLAPPLGGVSAAAVDFYVSTGRMPKQDPRAQSGRSPVRFTPDEIAALVRYVTSVSHGPMSLPVIRPGTDLADGKLRFIEHCAACHGAAAAGDSVGYGWVAPSLRDATPLQIAEAARVGPAVMPRFDRNVLSDAHLANIIAYVDSLRGPPLDNGGFDLGYTGPVAEGAVAWLLGLGVIIFFVRRIGTDV